MEGKQYFDSPIVQIAPSNIVEETSLTFGTAELPPLGYFGQIEDSEGNIVK